MAALGAVAMVSAPPLTRACVAVAGVEARSVALPSALGALVMVSAHVHVQQRLDSVDRHVARPPAALRAVLTATAFYLATARVPQETYTTAICVRGCSGHGTCTSPYTYT